MARPLRVEFADAVYHVMARGNERKAIYHDDEDRHRFLDSLAETVERFGVRLHAYCLMANHYHLLLDTPQANLSQAVGWLQVTYTVRFNRRHRRSGHLFQGRFKAQVVEADAYAQGLVEYIHLNPVRPRRRGDQIAADRARELAIYRWSSHRAYAGLERKPPAWLCQDWLRYWGEDPTTAHRKYRKSIARWFEGTIKNPWDGLIDGLVLGGEGLLDKVREHVARKPAGVEAAWLLRRQQSDCRGRLAEALARETDERIRIWARVRLGGERNATVAREQGYRDGSGVGQVVRRIEQRSAQDKVLRQKLARLKKDLSSVLS
ncbi:MAG TPA: transposase [Verrucomicrobiae bacterium]|nr:transposase [Verrucomicrobiae bacterium]